MAAQPVTPQRVKEILSSFLYESDRRSPSTSPEKQVAGTRKSQSPKQGTDAADSDSPVTSSQVASNRRTFSSFLKRVETFSPITWFAKPPELCPLVCSRFGWENTDYDMLHCTACNADLCGLLPSRMDAAAYKEACEALKKKLLTSHEKFCTLAVNPCPESFLKVALHDMEDLRNSFWQRVDALRKCSLLLPELVYTQLESWGFAESHAAKFCAEENLSETDTPTQVITLAFTGWTLREDNKQVLVCSLCRRQVGLWNYTPAGARSASNGSHVGGDTEHDEDGSGDSGPPSKLRKIEPQNELDPISSHHSWCPWTALRVPSEDAMTLLPSTPDTTPTTTCPSTPSSPSQSGRAQVEGEGSSPGGGGDAGKMLAQKQPAWVLVVRLVAPGLLSQSRRLVQQVKQSSIVEGLHCIRKMLKAWSSPEEKKPVSTTSSPS